MLLVEPNRDGLSCSAIVALTCHAFALQIFWSTVMAQTAPFLEALHFSKTTSALIMMSQPLMGTVIAPLVGSMSDRVQSKWGRRTPFIIGGATITSMLLIAVAWCEDLLRFTACLTVPCTDDISRTARLFAATGVIGLGIAIQPLQTGTRCLMMDQTPRHQHSLVTAWMSRLACVGGIVGFLTGSVDLQGLDRLAFRATNFQYLALLSSVMLLITAIVTTVTAREWEASHSVLSKGPRSIDSTWRHLRESFQMLQPKTTAVCRVQAWAWLAWFPLLFYGTTFVIELDALSSSPAVGSGNSVDVRSKLSAIRLGTRASLTSAAIAMACSVVIPTVVDAHARYRTRQKSNKPVVAERDRIYLLAEIWSFSQALLGLLLLASVLATTTQHGFMIISLSGFPWAINQWVPFAIIGVESAASEDSSFDNGNEVNRVGATLGIFNMAISAPQIVASMLAVLTYRAAEGWGSRVSTAWIFGLAGYAALAASMLTSRLLQRL